MFYNAHNGSVRVGNSEMDYVSFGNGNKNLIMLPGLGDGLATGMAFVFSIGYMPKNLPCMFSAGKIICKRDILQGKWQKTMQKL